jgi:predicted MFS family arabinose efflux permease
VAGGVALLLICLSFSALFHWAALEKLYLESSLSRFSVLGENLQKSLQLSTQNGQSVHRFHGITDELERAERKIEGVLKDHIPSIRDVSATFSEPPVRVSVILPDGTILYSSDKRLLNTAMPKALWEDCCKSQSAGAKGAAFHYTRYQNRVVQCFQVLDPQKKTFATVVLSLDQALFYGTLQTIIYRGLKRLGIVLACGASLLVLLTLIPRPRKEGGTGFSRHRSSTIFFMVITLAQVLFSGWNLLDFATSIQSVSHEKAHLTASLLSDRVEFLLGQGLRLDDLPQMEPRLADMISSSMEPGDLFVFERGGQFVLTAGAAGESAPVDAMKGVLHSLLNACGGAGRPSVVQEDLIFNGEVQGTVSIHIAGAAGNVSYEKLADAALDTVTMLVILTLLLMELLIFTLSFLERQPAGTGQTVSIHYGLMRPAAFLFLFGIDISMSFLPLHMGKLYEPILGFSKDFVMGLPISAEFFFSGVCILSSGVWMDRRGWHEPFLTGLLLATMGVLYSWLAPDAVHLILARAMVGAGYGLALMASQGFVIIYSDLKSKAHGLSQLFAGIYAGSICGGASGAILADRFGYPPVFFLGAMVLLVVIGYTLLVMRDAMQRPQPRAASGQVHQRRDRGSLLRFFSNRIVLSLIFLSSFPSAVAVVGFINYFSPVYLDSIGTSQSNVGRILMIYGVSMIYIGPFISRFVDASGDKNRYVFVGCVLGSMTFLCFYVLEGLWAVVVGVLLLGLSSSFVLASQSAYILQLRVSQELGVGKAMGIFRSSSRIGQALGPLVFGALMVRSDINSSVISFGLIYLMTALLFLLLTLRDQESPVLEYV